LNIYPSLDLLNGEFVRLKQGNFNDVTTYGNCPVSKAKEFEHLGATRLHVVDLDAARTGDSLNESILAEIAKNTNLHIQTGGGVRTMADIERKLSLGVTHVVIGTAAAKNPQFAKEAVKKFGDAIVIGIDAKNGIVATDGWLKEGTATAVELAKQMVSFGVKTIVYTDISKDGMMQGPNVNATAEMVREVGCDIIASGGVSCMEDLAQLAAINSAGVILGKSIFTNAIELNVAISKFEK